MSMLKRNLSKNKNVFKLVSLIVMAGINAFLIYWAFYFASILGYYLAVIGLIIFNVYYFFIHRFIFLTEDVSPPLSETTIKDLVNSLEYVEGHDEKVFSDKELTEKHTSISNRKDDENQQEETIEILKPNKVIKQESNYPEVLDLKAYIKSMQQHMMRQGLKVEMDSLYQVFSSLSAVRLCFLKNESSKITERFMELFWDYIGANYFLESPSELLDDFKQLTNHNEASKVLIDATNNENRLNFIGLTQVSLENFNSNFKPVIDYSMNPLIVNGVDERITLKNNTWFMVSVEDFDYDLLSKDVANAAFIIEINATLLTPDETVYENADKLSYHTMINTFNEIVETHLIEEDIWKKIDEVNFELYQDSSKKLDNRSYRQLERYSSVLNLLTDSQENVVDQLLLSKILPTTKSLNLNKAPSGDDLFTFFEKKFGLESLIQSKTLLKTFNSNGQ